MENHIIGLDGYMGCNNREQGNLVEVDRQQELVVEQNSGVAEKTVDCSVKLTEVNLSWSVSAVEYQESF